MKKQSKNEIFNNTFIGVQWDAKSIETVEIVARALLNLTELFISQNIQIESLLKIDNKNPFDEKTENKTCQDQRKDNDPNPGK
jgi:hypothetical protein